MPAKRPTGARSETVRCEKCGEYYAVTYKRCPFCEDDEPTLIFRRPKAKEPSVQPPRRRDREDAEEPDDDEYEALFRHRALREEPTPEPRPVRRARRDEDDEYEEAPPRRRARREEEPDEDEYEEPRRRRRRGDDYEDEDEDEYEPRRGQRDGGKRLVTNARGGGYGRRGPSPMQVIGALLSIALIVAAVWIVITIVKTFVGGTGAPAPGVSDSPAPSITVSAPPSPTGSAAPGDDVVVPSQTPSSPSPVVTTIPADQTATGFSLYNQFGNMVQDISLDSEHPSATLKAVFTPEGSTGSVTWQSSKPNIVTVSEDGKVTAVAKGVAKVTATMAGGYARECIVRSSVGGTPASLPPSTAPSAAPSTAPSAAPSASPSTGGKLSLNVPLGTDGVVYDFSLQGVGDVWTLKVKNAAGTVTWAVKDSSIATVDANGKVTGVAKGTTKVTATVDGQTLECIVRVN